MENHTIVTLKKGVKDYSNGRYYNNRNSNYHKNGGYHKSGYRKPYQYGNTETVEESAEKTEE